MVPRNTALPGRVFLFCEIALLRFGLALLLLRSAAREHTQQPVLRYTSDCLETPQLARSMAGGCRLKST